MKKIFRLLAFVLIISFTLHVNAESEIPEFNPNVVDPFQYLNADEVTEINETINQLQQNNILAAVYIIQELKEETIEQLSERAFRKWELGSEKKDNGILLVVAINDRKSRLEVGYGLEGDLPDITTKRILDKVFRTEMKNNGLKFAINKTLIALKEKNADQDSGKSPYSGLFSKKKQSFFGVEFKDDFNLTLVLIPYILFLFCLWFLPMFTQIKRRQLIYTLKNEISNKEDLFDLEQVKELFLFGSVPLRFFFMLNPGLFILFGAIASAVAAWIMTFLLLVVASIYFYLKTKPFRSYQNFLSWRNHQLSDKVKRFAQSGLRIKAGDSSASLGDNSDSSSSSSDSSSSSEGGSSGGGGSSSDW